MRVVCCQAGLRNPGCLWPWGGRSRSSQDGDPLQQKEDGCILSKEAVIFSAKFS